MSSGRAIWKVTLGCRSPAFLDLARDVVLDVAGGHQHRGDDGDPRALLARPGRSIASPIVGPGEFEEAGGLESVGAELLPGVGEGPELLDPRRVPAPVGGDQQGVRHGKVRRFRSRTRAENSTSQVTVSGRGRGASSAAQEPDSGQATRAFRRGSRQAS